MTRIIKKYSEPGEWEVVVPYNKVGMEKTWVGIIDARKAGSYKFLIIADHRAINTKGRVTIKVVVGANANVSIKGVIKIRKDAQKTDNYLEIRVLMLDKTARAVAEPELEIEANNVKASHGATIGRVDQTQMLYLMSKGLSKAIATEEIVKGFLIVKTDREV